MSVLIIDDNEIIRGMISIYLKNHGYETEEASNAETAEALLEQKKFNIIILDDFLSGIRGTEFCKRIKSKYPFLTVVGISASCEEKDFLTSGADAFLAKPFFLKELLQIITYYINNKKGKTE